MSRGAPRHQQPQAASDARNRVRRAFVQAGERGRTLGELVEQLAARLDRAAVANAHKFLARNGEIRAGEHVGTGFRWYLVNAEVT